MKIEFGKYIVDIDVEKTVHFYDKADKITQGCNCVGCCNFEKATDEFPDEVKSFFEKIGVDIKKAAEIIPYVSKNEKADVLYGGFYHVCGTLLTKDCLWQEDGAVHQSKVYRLDEDEMYQISENFKVGFCEGCILLEDGFPLPAIQIEIIFVCPWVLSTENPY